MLLSFAYPVLPASSDIKVVLINPDKEGRAFWDLTTFITQRAASDLCIDLNVIHGGGNRFNNYQIIKSLTSNDIDIDYVIFLPHKGKSEQYFNLLEQEKIPIISLERSMDEEEMEQLKFPDEKYKFWLSEVYFDDVQAGKSIGQALLAKHIKKRISQPLFSD